MRKLGLILLFVLWTGTSWGAWDASKPANDELLNVTPGLIRANWDAIATGTDAALTVTNAKVAAGAAIVDTKLATISTAGKVNSTAIVGLPSMVAGAGTLPVANGGTAANTAATARTSLGVAASGNNTDITRLNNLTTPLSIEQGGTNSTTKIWVDLTTAQVIAGNKNFTGDTALSNVTVVGNLTLGGVTRSTWSGGTNMVVYTSNATFAPPAGISTVFVEVVGGGGDGGAQNAGWGSLCGGGGGGGYAAGIVNVTAGVNCTVIVGIANGVSSFTSGSEVVNATGGVDGAVCTSAGSFLGGVGGAGITGMILVNGTKGWPGHAASGGLFINETGRGGDSHYGVGGLEILYLGVSGLAGSGYGAGGSGCSHAEACSGGTGTSGIVIVKY